MLNRVLASSLRYVLGLVFVALAGALQYWLWPDLAPSSLVLFFPTTVLISYICGLGPTVLCAFAGSALSFYVFVDPMFTWKDWERSIPLYFIFIASSIMFACLADNHRRARLRSERLMQSNMLGMVVFDFNGAILDVNDAFLNMLGYTREDLGELNWRKITPPEWLEVDQKAWGELREFGTMKPIEKEYVRRDGTRCPILVGGALFEGSRNQGVAYVLDLTAQKQSEARLMRALDFGQMNLWEWDLASGEVWRSEGHDRQFGLSENLGRFTVENFMSFIFVEDRERVAQEITAALRGEKQYNLEYRVVWPDGSIHWILTRGDVKRDGQGKALGMAGFSTEITRMKQVETDLQRAVQARDEFLSIASHELRTPMTSLNLQVQMLDRLMKGGGSVSQERIARVVGISKRQIGVLNGLLDDLLEVSRIANGRFVIERDKTNLTEVVAEVAEHFQETFAQAGCQIHFSLESEVIGFFDRRRLEQVVVNLLSNAAKYGQKKPVYLDLRRNGSLAELRVRDLGVGIPVEEQDKIFARFERASTGRSSSGLGLGLYIVNEIVSAHGGKMSVQSAPGEGAEFRMELPLNIEYLGITEKPPTAQQVAFQ